MQTKLNWIEFIIYFDWKRIEKVKKNLVISSEFKQRTIDGVI